MDLSIVIPAYKEAHKIARDIQAAAVFLQRHKFTGEIIVADDGSADATPDTARATPVPPGIELVVLTPPHRGKGSAVREGMKASRGDYVMFADSGLCVPFDDVLPALAKLKANECDIAHGSRKMPQSVIDQSQTFYRRILSAGFRWFVLSYLNLPRKLTDTQCGFKAYKGPVARELYAAAVTDGFMFDLEILMRARNAGYRVIEFPVHWSCDRDTRLKPSRILGSTLAELAAVKKTVAAGALSVSPGKPGEGRGEGRI
jgi:dolichyl-phosphate beta-glucosyltransferase